MNILLRHRTPSKPLLDPKYYNMCQKAAWRVRWDSNGHRNINVFFGTQRDWNQTLITRVNEIAAQIHRATLKGGANVIVVSPQMLTIFEDLEYYKSEDMSLGGRYRVIVDHAIHPLEVLVYYDAPDHIRKQHPDIDDNNRIYGVIRIDGVMGYEGVRSPIEKKEMVLLPKEYLLLTKHLVN